MGPRRRWMRTSLFVALAALSPALAGFSCESILRGPMVGPGDVDESWWQGRKADFLAFSTAAPDTGEPLRAIAHLERAASDPGFVLPPIAPNAFTSAFDELAILKDSSDFRALYLLNLLLGYRDHPGLGAAQVTRLEDGLLAYKFWYDQPTPVGIIDNNYYWSENHQIIFHTLEYLLGQEYPDRLFPNDGRTGAEHRAHARPLILDWLEHRIRFGFSEWHSDVYYQKHVTGLLTLVEFSDEEEIRARAAGVLDLVLFDIASHSLRGNMGVTHGRSYKHDKSKAINQDIFQISKLLFDTTSEPWQIPGDPGSTLLSRAQRYRLPEAILRIARNPKTSIDRQRLNLPVPELAVPPDLQAEFSAGQVVYPPPVHGVSYEDPDDFDVWLGQAALTAWPVVPHTIHMLETYDLWQSEHFAPFLPLRNALVSDGVLNLPFAQTLAVGIARMLSFAQLSEVNTYTYRTPDYMLSSVQSYRPGSRTDQRHTWQATLDEGAIVFTQHPGTPPRVTASWGEDDSPGPGYWTGEAAMPRSAQHENVTIQIYAPQYIARSSGIVSAISRYQPYTHAFFPQDRFDEVVQDGNWVFGRRGDGYVALYSHRAPAFLDYTGTGFATDGMTKPFDLRADGGPDNVWIAECASASEWSGDFAAFRAALANARVDVVSLGAPRPGTQSAGFSVTFESPSQGLVRFGWNEPLTVGGSEVEIADYPRFDNPWAKQAFGTRRVLVMDEPSLATGHGVWIDFERGVRRTFGPVTAR